MGEEKQTPNIITELFAFVTEDHQGDEGVIGASMNMPGVGPSFVPLVGADMKRVESFRPIAKEIIAENVRRGGRNILKLKRFRLESSEMIIEET